MTDEPDDLSGMDPLTLVEVRLAHADTDLTKLADLARELADLNADMRNVVLARLIDEDDRDERQHLVDWWAMWSGVLALSIERLAARVRTLQTLGVGQRR